MSGTMGGFTSGVFGQDDKGSDQRRMALANALMRSQPSPQSYSGSSAGSLWGGVGSGLTAALSANPELTNNLWGWMSGGGAPMAAGAAAVPAVMQTPLPPIGG